MHETDELKQHVWHGMDDSMIISATGVDIFKHVCRQMMDTSSNCRNNQNIHSATA